MDGWMDGWMLKLFRGLGVWGYLFADLKRLILFVFCCDETKLTKQKLSLITMTGSGGSFVVLFNVKGILGRGEYLLLIRKIQK
ncbi:hypothetical protein HanIR_Chr10g0467431 [Helianthus annuus]|nr:hypothetical protein HanIR_Chr10g0467431 [Helianthus annuus]